MGSEMCIRDSYCTVLFSKKFHDVLEFNFSHRLHARVRQHEFSLGIQKYFVLNGSS